MSSDREPAPAQPAPTDEELMAAYVGGDQAAFSELFRRYAPMLLRVMQRQLRRREDAHDLVQQTFLHLHRARNDFRPGARLRPWLFTIAVNLKREHFRRLGRHPETPMDTEALDLGVTAPDPLAQAGQVDAARIVHTLLAKLGPEQREVITLHWLEGLPFSEIALLVGASVNAVKVRAHRGYVAIRKMLDNEKEGNSQLRGHVPFARSDLELP